MELYFTRSTDPRRVFKLATGGTGPALVKGSPKEDLDFVLLRVSCDVAAALSVTAFACYANLSPVVRQGIHIIQHPGGGPLKISVDENGVTGVYPAEGKVQYISRRRTDRAARRASTATSNWSRSTMPKYRVRLDPPARA